MRFDGILVLDKPAGITSRDAVNRAQTWFPRGTRIGHTGTLDPLATGVLVLCVGVTTRLTEYVQAMPKVYRAGIILGATSDTDDADGTLMPTPNAVMPTREQLAQALGTFVGAIEQVPPAYSAAKVAGRRAYDLARKGKDFDLQPRVVTVHRIDILSYAYPHLDIEVRCGKGTYIRSLARDLGVRLGCAGYIASLRRTQVGWFSEEQAIALDSTATTARERLLPAWRAIQDEPPFALAEEEAVKLRNGLRVAFDRPQDAVPALAVVDPSGRMIAVVELADGWMRPMKVFPSEPEA